MEKWQKPRKLGCPTGGDDFRFSVSRPGLNLCAQGLALFYGLQCVTALRRPQMMRLEGEGENLKFWNPVELRRRVECEDTSFSDFQFSGVGRRTAQSVAPRIRTRVIYMYCPGQKKYNRLHRYAPHNNV